MADHSEPYLFDNEGSEDEKAEEEEDEKALAARDTWFGIANSTGELYTSEKGNLFRTNFSCDVRISRNSTSQITTSRLRPSWNMCERNLLRVSFQKLLWCFRTCLSDISLQVFLVEYLAVVLVFLDSILVSRFFSTWHNMAKFLL